MAVAIYEEDVREFLKLRSEGPPTNDLANAMRSLRPLTRGRYGGKIKDAATKLLPMLEYEASLRERASQRKRDQAFFAGHLLSTALKEYVTAPRREYDLDARFQVKIGFWLNFYFRGFIEKRRDISLRTISRLVVLFYIASGLAEYALAPGYQKQIKTVRLEKADRVTVSVRAVDQNLRRAGLNKMPG
jgi:hypothetical protein